MDEVGSSSPRKAHAQNGKISKKWFWVLLIGVFVVAAGYRWLWDVKVLDYGDPQKTYFDTAQAKAGQKVNIWFDGVTWYRIWKSDLHVTVICLVKDPLREDTIIKGHINLEPHPISVPDQPGPLARKSRAFTIPSECLPGPLIWVAYATSTGFPFGDWNIRRAYPPELALTIVQ